MKHGRRLWKIFVLLLVPIMASGCDILGPNEIVATPEINVTSDLNEQYIEITCATSGAKLYYDTSFYDTRRITPNKEYRRRFLAEDIVPLNSTSPKYVLARATKQDMIDSITTSREIKRAQKPEITYYDDTDTVTIDSPSLLGGIIYTTNGSTPSRSNGTKVQSTFVELQIPNNVSVIKAMAFGAEEYRFLDSQVESKYIY